MEHKENPPDDSPAGNREGGSEVKTTQFYHSAESIAHHYRPGARPESGGYFKIPCPSHRGDDNNLHLGDAQDGGLILKC